MGGARVRLRLSFHDLSLSTRAFDGERRVAAMAVAIGEFNTTL